MHKTLATLLAAAAFTTPFAQAENTSVTLELTYDRALLATEAGAKSVLDYVTEQAEKACAYDRPITGTPTVDAACRDNVVEQAIAKIREDAEIEGTAATYVFASL